MTIVVTKLCSLARRGYDYQYPKDTPAVGARGK